MRKKSLYSVKYPINSNNSDNTGTHSTKTHWIFLLLLGITDITMIDMPIFNNTLSFFQNTIINKTVKNSYMSE